MPIALSMASILGNAPRSADPAGGVAAVLRAWVDPTTSTDEEGRFALRFDPPAGMGFALELTLDPAVHRRWSWFGIEPGEEIDLGRVALERGASLRGCVLDEHGVPSGLAWVVFASATLRSSERSEVETSARAAFDPGRGSYRIEGLPPGTYELSASSPVAGAIEGPTIELGEITITVPEEVLDPRATVIEVEFAGGAV